MEVKQFYGEWFYSNKDHSSNVLKLL